MKISFKSKLEKYGEKGDKTAWTYFVIPSKLADKIKKGVKKSYRVKGFLDAHQIKQVSILPDGNGNFFMPFNASMRKATGKKQGDIIEVTIEADDTEIPVSEELLICLEDEPTAKAVFECLPASHKSYYSNWIKAAKTDATKTKRIAIVINGLARNMNFGAMLREQRNLKIG